MEKLRPRRMAAHAEVFEVFYRLVAKVARSTCAWARRVSLALLLPFWAAFQEHPAIPADRFVLFMLSSTAFAASTRRRHGRLLLAELPTRRFAAVIATVSNPYQPKKTSSFSFYYYGSGRWLFVSRPFAYLRSTWRSFKLTQLGTQLPRSDDRPRASFCFSLNADRPFYTSALLHARRRAAPAIVSMVSRPSARGWNLFEHRPVRCATTVSTGTVCTPSLAHRRRPHRHVYLSMSRR